MTYRVSQSVAQTTGSLHLALGKVRGTRKAPRVSEARDIARGRHTHLYHQNSLTTSKKTNPLTQIHYLMVNRDLMTVLTLHVCTLSQLLTHNGTTHPSIKPPTIINFCCKSMSLDGIAHPLNSIYIEKAT